MTMKRLNIEIYILNKLLEWKSEFPNAQKMNKLNFIKLTFFLCSINPELLKLFNFVAMPLGPIDKELLINIESEKIPQFQKYGMECNEEIVKTEIDNKNKDMIDQSFEELKKINYNLINYSSYDLVELVHQWYSWKENYNFAKSNQKYEYPISSFEIINEANKQYMIK
tara:strand:- start:182 stop:685 length:504 start_codon:yes stop_codon:yes gene_type:complete